MKIKAIREESFPWNELPKRADKTKLYTEEIREESFP